MNQSHYKVNVIILTGGKGERLQSSRPGEAQLPKQFLKIHGIPLFLYCIRTFLNWPHTGSITIAANPDYKELTESFLKENFPSAHFNIVSGGRTRHESVMNAIQAAGIPEDEDLDRSIWFIHDGARPNISLSSLDSLLDTLLQEADRNSGIAAATLAEKASETLVRADTGTMKISEPLNREEIFSIKTPQALTGNAFRKLADIPDSPAITDLVTWAAEGGIRTCITEIPAGNIKVTWPDDLKTAAALLKPFPYL